MIISVFKDGTFVLGVDCSYVPGQPEVPAVIDEETNEIIEDAILAIQEKGREDCIYVEDISFNQDTQNISIEDRDGEFFVVITEKQETPEAKHARIYESVITTESLEDIDLEEEIFSDFEIGEIITARVFGGNPHAEKALTNKVLAVTLALLQGVEMTEDMSGKIAEATAKKAEVDAVRNLFNLGNL